MDICPPFQGCCVDWCQSQWEAIKTESQRFLKIPSYVIPTVYHSKLFSDIPSTFFFFSLGNTENS